MKIRHGFVSNSSSSSFCIFGTFVEGNQEDLEEKATDVGLEVEWGDPNSSLDGLYVGLSPGKMGANETRKQFEDRVEDLLKKATGEDLSGSWISEGWYDG
jgi:hypothetical protein